jgi:hypothetical protein
MADLREQLKLAANRLRRLALECPHGSSIRDDACEWAGEADAALAAQPVPGGGLDQWHDSKHPEPEAYHHKVAWHSNKLKLREAWDARAAAAAAVRSRIYAALRSIRYNAEHGSQDRPLHVRLAMIAKEANETIQAMEAALIAAAPQPAAVKEDLTTARPEYPECSGDPASCPENEGYGCCKPNPRPEAKAGAGDPVSVAYEVRKWCSGDGAWTEWRQCTDQYFHENNRDDSLQFRHAQPKPTERGEGTGDTTTFFDVLSRLSPIDRAVINARLSEPRPADGGAADGVIVDAIAWREFLLDYGRYNEGDPRMPWPNIRDGLHAVIESAKPIQPTAGSGEAVAEVVCCGESPAFPGVLLFDVRRIESERHRLEVLGAGTKLYAGVPPADAEALIRVCVPGGSVCDPQQVADSIREYFGRLSGGGGE